MVAKNVRRAIFNRPASYVSTQSITDGADPIKAAYERALPVIAGLLSAIVQTELARREPVEPPLVACDTCGFDSRTVRRLVASGRLVATKAGRRWYAAPEALRALLPAPPPAVEPSNESEPVDEADRILNKALRETGLELAGPPSRAAPVRQKGGERRAGR